MSTAVISPAELIAECLTGAVRRLLGGAHSLTSSRAVVVCTDPRWVRVKFSAEPGRLPSPWEPDDETGWLRAPREAEPGLRDSSADPVLVVVGVGEDLVVAVNALAIDEIGVTCRDREDLIGNWLLQAALQGAEGDTHAIAGARLSANPDATVVVADPVLDGVEPGWVDVLAAGTSWPVRPLRLPTPTAEPGGSSELPPVGNFLPAALLDEDNDIGDSAAPPAPAGPAEIDAGRPGVPADAAVVGRTAQMTVFGGFEVTDAEGMVLQPMQQQIIGAIALHQPILTAQLCQMLYGAERQKSFHVAMSKVRRRGLQPVLTEQGYRIDIDSDWQRFTDLASPDPATAPTQALAEAVDLIKAPLLGADAPTWAVPLLPAMTDLVCCVCRELAARHADRPDQALAYARRGLDVDPGRSELVEIVEMLTNSGGSQDADKNGAP